MIFKIMCVTLSACLSNRFLLGEEGMVFRFLVMFRDRGEDPLDSSITSARFLNRSGEIGKII